MERDREAWRIDRTDRKVVAGRRRGRGENSQRPVGFGPRSRRAL